MHCIKNFVLIVVYVGIVNLFSTNINETWNRQKRFKQYLQKSENKIKMTTL